MLAEFLDFNIAISGVQLDIVSHTMTRIDFGPATRRMLTYSAGLVQSILSLPRLDVLSRRHNGPGYVNPPAMPEPGITLTISDVTLTVVDGPLESWLQRVGRSFLAEKAEQERREELLKIKIEALRGQMARERNSDDKLSPEPSVRSRSKSQQKPPAKAMEPELKRTISEISGNAKKISFDSLQTAADDIAEALKARLDEVCHCGLMPCHVGLWWLTVCQCACVIYCCVRVDEFEKLD